jgi:hypothetical protein
MIFEYKDGTYDLSVAVGRSLPDYSKTCLVCREREQAASYAFLPLALRRVMAAIARLSM